MVEKVARAIKDARALPGTKPVARLSDVDRRAARAAIEAMRDALRRTHERVGGIETPRMNSDNLSIILCSYFEDVDGEQDDNGWTAAATDGCDEVLQAIRDHYDAALRDGAGDRG